MSVQKVSEQYSRSGFIFGVKSTK